MTTPGQGHDRPDVASDQRRLPNVDEALLFSPLASIIPYSSDRIPVPKAWTSTAPLRLLSAEQAQDGDRLLSALGQEAKRVEGASRRLQQTIADVRHMLASKDSPQYKFKSLDGNLRGDAKESPQKSALDRLNPFARRLLEASRNHHVPPDASLEPAGQAAISSVNQTVPRNATSHSRPLTPPSRPNHTSDQTTPRTLLSANAQDQPTEAITSSWHIQHPVLSQELKAEFLPGEDLVSRPSSKLGSAPNDAEVVDHLALADQRQKAAAARSRLEMLTKNILRAQSVSKSNQHQTSEVFTTADVADGTVDVLTMAVQTELDKAIHVAARQKALKNISVDDLVALQKLCFSTVKATADRYLGIGDGWDDADISEWANKLALADQALVASRSILRIMSSGIEDKAIYSEEILSTLLDFVKQSVNTLIAQVVELRSSKEEDSPFRIAFRQKPRIAAFFKSIGRVIGLMGNVFHAVDMDETAVTAMESLCTMLVFVENAPSEAESALGIQTFETLRRTAMDALAKLFARNKGQRQSIFDDILTSLERLPVGRQSARQYKLADAKPIQLVSALLMRLIQTSTMLGMSEEMPEHASAEYGGNNESSDEDADFSSDEDNGGHRHKRKPKSRPKGLSGHANLLDLSTSLYDAASSHAKYVSHFLVSRAINTSKSSGEPYRNLLDIFVEDFLNVLGKTDWPAAELLLRQLIARLHDIVTSGKSTAPSKAMALELIGTMCSGITDLRLHTVEAINRVLDDNSPLMQTMKSILEAMSDGDDADPQVFSLQGPYRAVVEFIRLRASAESHDAHLATALSFHLTQWAQQVVKASGPEPSGSSFRPPAEITEALFNAIRNPQNCELDGLVQSVVTEESRLAAALVTLRLPFCKLFNVLFSTLLKSMSSDQASLRSKSLRSVEDVLQKDPSILDQGAFVINNIVKCMIDASPQVRDAALGLLSTCLQLRPKLDVNAIESILSRTTDPASGVKKRAIKLSKEVYLRNDSNALRSRVADALIHCISDTETTVVELARQTIEDVWFVPHHKHLSSEPPDARSKTALAVQVSLIVETVQRSSGVSLILQDLLEDIMSSKSKVANDNIATCKSMVMLLVDAIIDNHVLPGGLGTAAVMRTLSIFAQARAKLFTSTQLQPLLPYLKNLSTGDDLDVYRYTIVILRCTLPHVSNLAQNVVTETQASLLSGIQKLPPQELKEVAACLWALANMSGTPDRLVRVTVSSMEALKARASQDLTNPTMARQVERLLALVGTTVTAFDLDSNVASFKHLSSTAEPKQVVQIAVNLVAPLTGPKSPKQVRTAALTAMLDMCQAWPEQYRRADVSRSLELVLSSGDDALQIALMKAWREFFVPGTDRRPAEEKSKGAIPGIGAGRIEQTYVATARDSSSAALAQRFIPDVIKIALESTGELSIVAAHVVININKTGMVHPRDSGTALVALQTSKHQAIAQAAAEEYAAIFAKYESIFEKENVRAVQQAFNYQQNTVKDVSGFVGQPPVAKLQLFWEVLKTCSVRVRKRFLTGVCTLLDFEHGKLELGGHVPPHVELVGFCVQNLALFDYHQHSDLTTLVDGLDKVFSATGTAVAHGIERNLLHQSIDAVAVADASASNGHAEVTNGATGLASTSLPIREVNPLSSDVTSVAALQVPIDHDLLRALTAGSQILLLLYELRTFLRRVYSMSKPPGVARGRLPKDANKKSEAKEKALQRVPNAALMTERFLAGTKDILNAMATEETRRQICLRFQEKISVDDEVKVKPEDGGSEDAMVTDDISADPGGIFGGGAAQSPSADGYESSAVNTPQKHTGPGPSRKRKVSSATPAAAAVGTPRKRKRKSGDGEDSD